MSTIIKAVKEGDAIVEKRTIAVPKGVEVTLLGTNHIKKEENKFIKI